MTGVDRRKSMRRKWLNGFSISFKRVDLNIIKSMKIIQHQRCMVYSAAQNLYLINDRTLITNL